MKNTFIALLAAFGLLTALSSYAQESYPKDPAGYITKYDANFDGIGPQIYFLPAPLPKVEVLKAKYKETSLFFDTLTSEIQLQKLLKSYAFTQEHQAVQALVTTSSTNPKLYIDIADQALSTNNLPYYYAALNHAAYYLTVARDYSQASALLQKALLVAEQNKNSADIQAIQQNLVNLYMYTKQEEEASKIEQAQFHTASKEKNQLGQAYSLLNKAKLLHIQKDFRQAENTIIRKVFPLFNRSKNLEGKAKALVALAEIYRTQNKFTEAQWFLLQARDIVHERNIHQEFSAIEYLLGTSKFEQGNLNIAKSELHNALKFNQLEDNKLLQLAIIDRLGRIALAQNDLYDADEQLKKYWKLRKEIF